MKKVILVLFGGKKNLQRILSLRNRLVLVWLSLAIRSRLLVRLHYVLFSDAFEREAEAVMAGRIAFTGNQAGGEPTNYFLRRAVHRLEKGLIMEPRRGVFGLDYIQDAVDAYLNSSRQSEDSGELQWARDVLRDYFATVDSHPVIELARRRFEAAETGAASSLKVPYQAGTLEKSPVTWAGLRQLARQRRSVRWYQQKAVPRDLVDQCLEVGLQAPSACNRQPYRFLVYDDPQMIQQVARLPMGVAGFEHNFPMLIAVVGRLRAYSHPRDRHAIYVDASLAAMGFMLALETQGLSSCPINWPDIKTRERAASGLLGLAPDERIVMFISVGYAREDGKIPFSEKVSVQQTRHYNPDLDL